MTIIELLENAKSRANIPSDYALAKVLGIDRSFVSSWRRGKSHPGDEDAVKLATLAGLDEMQVIAQIHYETATNEKKKEFWHQFLERRGIAATIGLIALGASIVLTPEPAEAGVLQLRNYDEQNSDFEPSEIYIMRTMDAIHAVHFHPCTSGKIDCYRDSSSR